jgi:glyoxylase-like metal-dependent hydrolase (beta-lactamase superfamily II)
VSRPPDPPRCERVAQAVWRLRLSLPWPAVPHGNCWAVATAGGITLFDTGRGDPGRLRDLDLALSGAGYEVDDIRLVVCTHSHADHYGLGPEIAATVGCELWMHPAWKHVWAVAEEPEAALERRIEAAHMHGIPEAVIDSHRIATADDPRGGFGVLRAPDRELVNGVEVETDVGAWRVVETPGHAPSHVILHQADSGLAITGDHLLGKVALHFDYGNAPDPVTEYLDALDATERLRIRLCLPGHGRTFTNTAAKIAETRTEVNVTQEHIRERLAAAPLTAHELLVEIRGLEAAGRANAVYEISIPLAFLDRMTREGLAAPIEGSQPLRWRATT